MALLGEGSPGRLRGALKGRLRAIAAKLRLGDHDPESLRAAEELERQLERFRRTERRNVAVGLAAFLALGAALAWLLTGLARWLRGR